MSHYVKFTYQRARPDIAPFEALAELNACRRKLLEQRLIGVDSNGVGFGNLSVRDGVSGNFYITGSATGGLPELTPTDCVRVVAYDFARNWLRYEGAAIPSSESLTHAAIYESDPTVSAVIHCHDSVLWRTRLDRVPTTSKAIAYGTPEMAYKIMRLFTVSDVRSREILRHGGTRRRHCDLRKKSRRRIRCCDARTKGIIALHLKTVFMNVSPRVMTDELAARNQERGVTRRRFVGITLASGAAILAGKSDVILGANTATSSNMATNPTFNLGGDFTVNRLGFGAMRVTGEGIWGWPPDRQNALKVLRRAVELGVNLIDTADAYGPDTSELLIAEALYPYPKGLVIATKGGLTRPGPGQWVPNCRPDHLKQALDGSLKRLRLDRIDLYQLHTVDSKVPIEESVGALKQMQDAGKIRHIGLSNVDRKEIDRARKIVPIVSVQNRYNIEDRESEDVLVYCETGKAWISAVVPDRRRQRIETGKSAEDRGKRARRQCFSSGAGLASRAIAGNAADSRHVISGALGRKRRRRQAQIDAGRMEGD